MKQYIAPRVAKEQEGIPYQSDKTYAMHNETCTVLKDNGDVLAIFIKGYIKDKQTLENGRKLIRYKQTSNNRGHAAGIDEKRLKYKGNSYRGNGTTNNVNSSIVGYFEDHGFYKCRQTALYSKHIDAFKTETMNVVQCVSDAFQKYAPKHYAKQLEFVEKINQNMRLENSVYTTITVNVDFRTFGHRDKGDFWTGLGNLTVFNVGDYTGGELLLPDFRVGFQIEEGDVLLFDVHELHCNNPIKGHGRVSLVCYAREKILRKCANVSAQQLIENVGNRYQQHGNGSSIKTSKKTPTQSGARAAPQKRVYLIGYPGSGKTTLVSSYLNQFKLVEQNKTPIKHEFYVNEQGLRVLHLGWRSEVFGGTDMMPNSAISVAVPWLTGEDAPQYDVLIGEGDRLASKVFFDTVKPIIVFLNTPPEVCEANRKARAEKHGITKVPSPTWIKARITKTNNLCQLYKHETIDYKLSHTLKLKQLNDIVAQSIKK